MNYYTHGGWFHADELMGYVICRMAGEVDELVRLEDYGSFIPTDGIVADIGMVYNPGLRRFDHHQGMMYRPNGYPYASAGLLWKEYGMAAISNQLGLELDEGKMVEVWEYVDRNLMQGLDAHDSSNEYQHWAREGDNDVRVHSLSQVVSMYNSISNPIEGVVLVVSILTQVLETMMRK